MTRRVLIFSLNIKSMISKKNGLVAHFVKSRSMKAVFTNYIYIIYYIFIASRLFSLKVPFVNINLSDGQLTFRLKSALILALISSNMFEKLTRFTRRHFGIQSFESFEEWS